MKKTVVIVDDDLNIRNLLFNYLKESEFNVIGEKSGSGLVNLFRLYKGKVDILVLDLVVPDLDQVKEFLQNKLNRDIHVVIITGYNANALVKELRILNKAKSFCLLRKPFSKNIFLETLRTAINQNSKEV